MHSLFRLSKAWFIIIGLILVLLVAGCEPWLTITIDNRTSFPIQVDIRPVPLDYSDTPSLTWHNDYVVIQPGKSQAFRAIQNDRYVGSMNKYVVIAVTQTNEVVFSRVFTWDELHDMGWRVEIVMQKQE